MRVRLVKKIFRNRNYLSSNAIDPFTQKDNTGQRQLKIYKSELCTLSDFINTIHESRSNPFHKPYRFSTIFTYKLNREIPHIVFDNKFSPLVHAGGIYLEEQKLSFEGNFDEYFKTYTPINYHIDTVSVFTPNVLQLMLELTDCDIELRGDKLLVYTHLVHNDFLELFKQKCIELGELLNENLATYRDNRLPSKKRSQINEYAKSLLQRTALSLYSSIFTLIIYIFTIYYLISSNKLIADDIIAIILYGLAVLAWFFSSLAEHQSNNNIKTALKKFEGQ